MKDLMLGVHPDSARKPGDAEDADGKKIRYETNFPEFMSYLKKFSELIKNGLLREYDVYLFKQDLLNNDWHLVSDYVQEVIESLIYGYLRPRIYIILFDVLKFGLEHTAVKNESYFINEEKYKNLCLKLLEFRGPEIANEYNIEKVRSFLDKKYVVLNPSIYLKGLSVGAKNTEIEVKNLFEQILRIVARFKMITETVLLRDESFSIKGFSGMYGPCLVKGIEFIARPFHNNCCNDNVSCTIDIFLRLIIERNYDVKTEVTYYAITDCGWTQPFVSVKFKEKGPQNDNVVYLEKETAYNGIVFMDVLEFRMLKNAIRKGAEIIGLPFES